ncbi:MAG: PHP domain-containing protein [Verrucomicrobiota bacterium]|nr:PHP domain-containing protein [Verrucomicrobiota bacterium]
MSDTSLNDFDSQTREQALKSISEAGEFPEPSTLLNLHAHTFYSFNYKGFSPSTFAVEAKRAGLEAAGIVDFDVLDGLDEFWSATRKLDIKACVGLESRVFVPEFSDRVINSPGEPGISYHMGTGFTTTEIPQEAQEFLDGMRTTSEQRNRSLLDRVNAFLNPLTLDYDQDVLPLTPKGNATERHLCLAYARKAAEQFPEESALRAFWSEKLGVAAEDLKDVPDGRGMTDLIRAKTMKKGGVGYVQPDSGSFPKMAEMNQFVLKCGALPTLTWLDGSSDGEQAIRELVEVGKSTGVVAFNVIPDRNYTPGSPDQKLKNLQEVIALTEELDLPLVGGTEMNSPGQKLVDSFETEELSAVHPVFLRGARIFHAHSTLQKLGGMGYLSDWADGNFSNTRAKNDFYDQFGEVFWPRGDQRLQDALSPEKAPEEVLSLAKEAMAAA